MALLGLLLVALLTSQAMATCSDQQAVQSFNEADFVRHAWYHMKQTKFNWPGGEQIKCPHSYFTLSDDGHFDMHLSMFNTSSNTPRRSTHHMHKTTEGSTEASYSFHRNEESHESNSFYKVLNTDYATYAVTWLCAKRPGSDKTIEVFFLMMRDKDSSAAQLEQASAHLPSGEYTTNDQSGCSVHEHR